MLHLSSYQSRVWKNASLSLLWQSFWTSLEGVHVSAVKQGWDQGSAVVQSSSSFQTGQLVSSQSLAIFYLCNQLFLICVWYFYCLFMLSCTLCISNSHNHGELLKFESFLTNSSNYSHIIWKNNWDTFLHWKTHMIMSNIAKSYTDSSVADCVWLCSWSIKLLQYLEWQMHVVQNDLPLSLCNIFSFNSSV